MKRLLILLILFPVILLAQKQGQDAIDSMQDVAINLQSMASSMGNDRCTKVADIHIIDNGEYTTVVVFRHDTAAPNAVNKENTEPEPPKRDERVNIANMEIISPQVVEIGSGANTEIMPHKVNDIALITEIIPSEVTDTVTKAITKADTPANKENTKPDTPKPAEIRTPVDSMHLSPDGYGLLQKLEGYSPSLYVLGDGGYTIGFGFFIPYNEGNKWRNGVTWERAESMMQQKMPAYEDQVKEYINVPLTQNEFDALTMLAYNLGGFSKATSIINDINNQVEFDVLQRDWKRFIHSKAPKVSKGLLNRRKDELGVRKLSNYQPERKIQIYNK